MARSGHRHGERTGSRRRSLMLLVAAGLAMPDVALADADDRVALGVGFHGIVHRAVADTDGNAVAGGAQVRLKLGRFFSLRMDYDFAQDRVAEVEKATTLSQLVPYPDLRLGLGVHGYPNRYASPYLTAGTGINTGTGVEVPVFFGGLGLETTLFRHWVLGASWQVYYATAGRYSRFMEQQKEAAQDITLVDLVRPHTYQVNVELTYYL